MMNNLFSMFDPSSTFMSMAWLSTIIPLMMLIKNKMQKKNKWNLIKENMMNPIIKEMKPLLESNMKKGITLIMMMTFMIIMMSNMMALSPFTFTPTAHIMVSFPTAMMMWVSLMMFGWIKNTKNMMAHTVPTGTPLILMNFMVMIEMVSNLIRPITLSIRMSANMVAGHLLLSLLGNFAIKSMLNLMLSSLMMIILSLLEMAVALIQGYVFMTLMTLYSTEIH